MRLLLAMMLLALPVAQAQQIEGAPAVNKPKGHVVFVPEAQVIAANKATTLVLHFSVEEGFHINSHTPHAASLIPTKLAVQDDPTANVRAVDFPKGHDYSFAFDPKEKLDVYTGDFALTLHVTAKPGEHTLKGALHYQACDSAACYPPRLLPVEVLFTAK